VFEKLPTESASDRTGYRGLWIRSQQTALRDPESSQRGDLLQQGKTALLSRTLPRSGTFYLVAYTPADPKPGDKLWLAVGTKERFKFRDLFTFRCWKKEIRDFHELH
jgi:hypothetical protein